MVFCMSAMDMVFGWGVGVPVLPLCEPLLDGRRCVPWPWPGIGPCYVKAKCMRDVLAIAPHGVGC